MTSLVFLDTETTGLALDDEIWEFAAICRNTDGSEVEHHWFIHHRWSRCSELPEPFLSDHQRRYKSSIAILLRRYGFEPGWHYHLIDVESLAIGYIAGVGARAVDEAQAHADTPPTLNPQRIQPPWSSEELSRVVGVEPDDYARHTALGDARWARAIYDAVTSGVTPSSEGGTRGA